MLREIVVELLRQLNNIGVRRVSRTKIMKLLYLIDRECRIKLHSSCTGIKWILWWHGPFSRKVLDVLDELELVGVVDSKILDYGDYVAIEYMLTNPYYKVQLNDKVKHIIEDVVRRWGKQDLKKILEYVYDLPEVREAGLGDEL